MKYLPILALLLTASFLPAQEAPSAEKLEAAFVAMLNNATLKGSWVPVQGGDALDDGYRIARAEKVEGDKWKIVSKMKFKGREIEYPMPVTIKWAGDVAVMILDDVPAGRGKKYSARVMYHNDRYAGSWWSASQEGGLLSGAITRPEPADAAK